MYRTLKVGMHLNPFPNKPWFLRVCSRSLLKTPWEKEKLFVTSNFSFSHSVFYPSGELSAIFIKIEIVVCKLFQFGRVKNLSFGKGLSATQCTFRCRILSKTRGPFSPTILYSVLGKKCALFNLEYFEN